MLTHISSLPQNPTNEQLTHKVLKMSADIEIDSTSLPLRIKEIINDGFSSLGWSFKKKKVVNSGLFSFLNLSQALRTILDQVENWSPEVDPTAAEVYSLPLACSKLWDLDVNRLVPDRDYVLDLQSGKNMYDSGDFASKPLFSFIDEKVLERPTFKAFSKLLDNYYSNIGVGEDETDEERVENMNFLRLVMDTAVMKYTYKYLLLNKKTKAATTQQFISELYEKWFKFYTRKSRNDSSGFEHVFIGEIKDEAEVVGFHNWIQLYSEERKGAFNYLGYVKPKRRAGGGTASRPASSEQLVSLQFEWKGARKLVSSSLIGTSPEFEMALYTLCFYSGVSENTVMLGPYKVQVTCYTWPPNPKPGYTVFIGTSFPSEAPLSEDEAATRIQSKIRTSQYEKRK